MSQPPPLSVDNVLRFLQVRGNGASLYEIQRGLHLRKSDHRPLIKMLAKLKKRKAIDELPGGRFKLVSRGQQRRSEGAEGQRSAGPSSPAGGPNSLTGRLILHQDGYGFVVLDKPMPQLDRDVFIPRDAIGDAMHGDHVEIVLRRLTPGTDGQRAEGRIVRVLDRAHPSVV